MKAIKRSRNLEVTYLWEKVRNLEDLNPFTCCLCLCLAEENTQTY